MVCGCFSCLLVKCSDKLPPVGEVLGRWGQGWGAYPIALFLREQGHQLHTRCQSATWEKVTLTYRGLKQQPCVSLSARLRMDGSPAGGSPSLALG